MENTGFLESYKAYGLNMGALRKFVSENTHLPDGMPVLCERVTDIHFETGWETYKVKGEFYHSLSKQNEDAKMDSGGGLRILSNEELDAFKEEFIQSQCIVTDNKVVLIYNHF